MSLVEFPSEGTTDRHFSWTREQVESVAPGHMIRFGDGDYLWVLGWPYRTGGPRSAMVVIGLWIPASEMDPDAKTFHSEDKSTEYDLAYLDPSTLEAPS